jgi:hypothetical protein
MGTKFLYKTATASFAVTIKMPKEDRVKIESMVQSIVSSSLRENRSPNALDRHLAAVAEAHLGTLAQDSSEVEWCRAQGFTFSVHYDQPLLKSMAFRLEMPDKYAPLFKLTFGGR